ncbi:MAG: LysR family transcriptional regulator, partial [Xanthomonadales bacterium]|nr:LysR family transcriptional regulator [Xanthomonadales bacterium]
MGNTTQRFYYKGNQAKQLRAFCAVARTGKMTDAAEQLFLSQPAVSLQIRALEEELSTVLFERHGPRINLTREGQALYEMARPVVEGLDSLFARFDRQVKGDLDSGEVVIAAGESTIIYLLPPLVRQFRDRHPNIHVQLRNVTGRDGLAMIREDEVDFAIGSMLDVPSDISYQPVYSYDPALILPIGHPLAETDNVGLED